MRVTNKMINNNLLLNLNRGLSRLEKINNQLGTKKKINLPSDDPVKAGVILRTSSSIREVEQLIRNVDASVSWLDATDVVLQDVISVIHRAKDLAVNGASTHLDDTARKALADEVAQLFDNVFQLANSTHGGRYLFALQYTDEKPFTKVDGSLPVAEVEYLAGRDLSQAKPVQFDIGADAPMEVSLDGRIFEPIFNALRSLYEDLTQPGRAPDAVLGELDAALDGVLRKLSEIGGKQNRVDLARERFLDLQLNLTKILSEEQDLDYAEAIMELKMEEFAYRTALAVGARIIQPSLVDFLR
ncbi:MAG TPA: flagellar hook-associated protein FlgL [Limnochordia bacterium]|nr:flagellar hook-associated protein FlgL [Limnochordia bacterium]